MFVAFMVMWACTPSSLRRDTGRGGSKAVGSLPKMDDAPEDTTGRAGAVAGALRGGAAGALVDSLGADGDVAGALRDSLGVDGDAAGALRDSLGVDGDVAGALVDSLGADGDAAADVAATGEAAAEAAAKLKRDTTMMDSLELAIYRYNKQIDDSLRLDSLNRQKKNGIDAPVK